MCKPEAQLDFLGISACLIFNLQPDLKNWNLKCCPLTLFLKFNVLEVLPLTLFFQTWTDALQTPVSTKGLAVEFLSTSTVYALRFGPVKFATKVSYFLSCNCVRTWSWTILLAHLSTVVCDFWIEPETYQSIWISWFQGWQTQLFLTLHLIANFAKIDIGDTSGKNDEGEFLLHDDYQRSNAQKTVK